MGKKPRPGNDTTLLCKPLRKKTLNCRLISSESVLCFELVVADFLPVIEGHHLITCFGQPHVPAAFVANENIDLQIDVSSLYVCDILRM